MNPRQKLDMHHRITPGDTVEICHEDFVYRPDHVSKLGDRKLLGMRYVVTAVERNPEAGWLTLEDMYSFSPSLVRKI